jgi:type IV pilus assembly protein PilM
MADETSIWKKEIRLRRKPKEAKSSRSAGTPVPRSPNQPAKLESVAELLRPLAEQAIDPVILPPVTPHASTPVQMPLVSPPAPVAPHVALPGSAAEEPQPELQTQHPAAPAAEAPPTPVERKKAPRSTPDTDLRPRQQSRRERNKAERDAKAERKSAAALAKVERRPLPSQHNRLVGLKIGATHLAAAEVVNKGGPRIVRTAHAPLERGIIVGGELREAEELVPVLKAFFRKHKLPPTCVRLGISNNRIGVRSFEISGIDEPKQLANAIRFRAQETLPIPLDEAVLDYRILEERVAEDGTRTRKVLLVVAHRDLVERYVAACRKAGLKLVGIDLEAFALLRALGDPDQRALTSDDAGLVCVSIGHDRSTLAVSNGQVCEFTRVLAWGGSSLDVAVARVLDLTPSEAEPIKRALALGGEGEAAGLDAGRADAARRAMAGELQNFARELVASLRFYQEQPGSLGIGEIVVTGGGAACAGLAQELERLIGVSIRVGDPFGRVKLPRKMRKSQDGNGASGSLAVAVGLGIED